jgi:urease subunit gamma/beta
MIGLGLHDQRRSGGGGGENARVLLTPTERDRLLLFTAAELARARRARGLRLNVPETIALVADTVCEAARDGARHAEALAAGHGVLGPDDVLPGVADVVTEVAVEAVFDDGSRLVIVDDPIGGASLGGNAPGAVLVRGGDVAGAPEDPDADAVELAVVNTAAVPVSVSSHYHFFEANPRLRFDRAAAYGRHLAVAAGETIRFDPGVPVDVRLVPFGGARVVIGFSGLVDGPLDAPGARAAALERARAFGYLTVEAAPEEPA